MIKVDSNNNKDINVQVRGNRQLVCLELMLAIVILIGDNVIQDKDKKVLKNVLDLDTKSLENVLQNLKETLNEF